MQESISGPLFKSFASETVTFVSQILQNHFRINVQGSISRALFRINVQEGVNEDFMWSLAEKDTWDLCDSRGLCFVESAIALPPTAVCVECELRGQSFSKVQLTKHPGERRCQTCIRKATASVYRPASIDIAAVMGSHTASLAAPAVVRVDALPAYAGAVTTPVAICSVCHVQLTKINCSTSQRSKVPSRRRCYDCVGSNA